MRSMGSANPGETQTDWRPGPENSRPGRILVLWVWAHLADCDLRASVSHPSNRQKCSDVFKSAKTGKDAMPKAPRKAGER